MKNRSVKSSILEWMKNCLLDASTVEVIPSRNCIRVQAVTKFITFAEHSVCYLQVLVRRFAPQDSTV